jgi:cell division septation protein DedD
VQVAALLNPVRARALLGELAAAGYAAYVVQPGADDPDGPYRIRVGGFASREAAVAAAVRIGRLRRERLYVVRDVR